MASDNQNQLCPLRFANPAVSWGHPGNHDLFKCTHAACPWWSTYHDSCSAPAIALSLQGILEVLKNLPEWINP